MPDETVRNMNMIPAHSLDEAMSIARGILDKDTIAITVIPEGVSVIVKGE